MKNIVVYSCVTGNYDNVDKTLLGKAPEIDCDATFVLFSDAVSEPQLQHNWQILPLHFKHSFCRRRTARWHKVNSHVLFPYADITVWVDGSQSFKPVLLFADLIRPHLQHSVATFKHPIRNCVYQELNACIKYRKDNELLMRKQIESYRADGYPPHNGMVETACVIRRNTPEIVAFNKAWWAEIDKHSFRDQLSFNYVAHKTNTLYSHVPGHRESSAFFHFTPHK